MNELGVRQRWRGLLYPVHNDGDFMVQLDTSMLTVTFFPALNSGSVCIIYVYKFRPNSAQLCPASQEHISADHYNKHKHADKSVAVVHLKLMVKLKNLSQGLTFIIVLLNYRRVLLIALAPMLMKCVIE